MSTQDTSSPYELVTRPLSPIDYEQDYIPTCAKCALGGLPQGKYGYILCMRPMPSDDYPCPININRIYALRHKLTGDVLNHTETKELYDHHRAASGVLP